MIEESASRRWVPIYVPAELASDVLRQVATFLEAGEVAAGPSQWADASADDVAAFFGGVTPLEWRLVVELARRDGPTTVAELADALGVEMGAVAGAMGPVNKRARREGWAPPIEPRRFTPAGESSSRRGLVLAAGLRAWMRTQPERVPGDGGRQMSRANR